MPSSRRRFLAAAGSASAVALAGCAALGRSVPETETHTGLHADPSEELESEPVFLAGDRARLPEPPARAESVDDARVVLATPDVPTADLATALRNDHAVAVTGDGATDALAGTLDAASDTYQSGFERIQNRDVALVVAAPLGIAMRTFAFPREDGWNDPVLDPLGWALSGRLPDAETFVPESSWDDDYETVGLTTVAGRLDSGEAYAMRTRGEVLRYDDGVRTRFHTRVHVAAGDGYGVNRAMRRTTVGDGLLSLYPNPHTEHGVQVANRSGTDHVEVAFSPAAAEARAALTGQCGVSVDGIPIAYDCSGEWEWRHDGLLSDDYRSRAVDGRSVWFVDA